MFKSQLSNQLLRILGERNLTVTEAAELSNMSRNYFTNLLEGNQTASLNMLENICSGFEVNPDELLISEKSKSPDKATPMLVTKVFCYDKTITTEHKPLCPNCNKLLERDNQAYCDKCGQRLSWRNYKNAELVCDSLKDK
jgi:transcriptional regulator with XRE-family HTH domain